MATQNNDTTPTQVRLDLSRFRRPARAVAEIDYHVKRLEGEERCVLGFLADGPDPEAEATLARVQAKLATLEYVRAALTDDAGLPLEVYPAGCAPTWDAEARARGQKLHRDLGRLGYGGREQRAIVAEVLGRSEGEDLHFRWLTKEEVREARALIEGLGVAGRSRGGEVRQGKRWGSMAEADAEMSALFGTGG